ncbi:MAG: lipopolysaccharide core heptose(I) kinase RfaP [Methylophilus sp.]
MTILNLPSHIKRIFGEMSFDEMMRLNGRVFRDVHSRKTIQVNLGEHRYFVKQHFGIGWAEIFKSLISFKKPVLSAMTEVHAIEELIKIGIPTTPLVGYGERGVNPASIQSFVVTEDLGEIISLEELCADWKVNPPDYLFKQKLIIALAQLSKKLHGAGMCHRDYYLCHFVLKKTDLIRGGINLILIDLHRVLLNQHPNGVGVMKDIAALMFSSMDSGFDEEDWTLFKQHYLPQSDSFWKQVRRRAEQLYQKFHSEKFQKRLNVEKSAID